MLYKTKYLLTSTALLASMLHASVSLGDAGATTTVEKTVTETTPSSKTVSTTVMTNQPGTTRTEVHWESEQHSMVTSGTRIINFMDFDTNKDHVLSLYEIGHMLFKLYDTDGNEIIDNNEYERRAVVTVMPMEKNTVISYDFDGDGVADKTERTYETFMQETQLTLFDKNENGLSPHEFAVSDFLATDVNHDKAIDLKEWQGSYVASIDKANKEKARFNK